MSIATPGRECSSAGGLSAPPIFLSEKRGAIAGATVGGLSPPAGPDPLPGVGMVGGDAPPSGI